MLSLTLLLTLASVVHGQTPVTCGIVDIDGPSEAEPGTPLVLKARVTSMLHTSKPEFVWKVSVGTIVAGQGTDEITVDTVGLGGQELTATVELSGAPLGCRASMSKARQFKPPPLACGLAFDQYGDIRFDDEKARLDNFAIQIQNSDDSLSAGLILMSAGRETYEGETRERLDRARSYLVGVRDIDPNRLVTLDCGFSQELRIKLYIVPPGAAFPGCFDNEVPLVEVKFTKPRPKPSKKRR
ncbi:MAG TPA: hypothetical protein VFR78_24205 [Pyrinomonadaceae bacterium]|nr:hypothetical protein [Pyrinomonadaceae bacterium]